MIEDIYYILGIISLLILITHLIQFKKVESMSKDLNSFYLFKNKEFLNKNFKNKEYKFIKKRIKLIIYEFLWSIFGCFTSNWFIFLFLYILSYLVTTSIEDVRFTKIGKTVFFISILFKILIYSFLIINHFYLNINILSNILEFFN